MVPLMRCEYMNQIEGNWKTKLFYEFVQENKLEFGLLEFDNSSDNSFCTFIKSISDNNSQLFNIQYLEFSKRKPSEDNCPWLFDDYLIFILIIGIIKFKTEKTWILDVLDKRSSKNSELSKINTTFFNILNEDYNSKSNFFELIFVFQEICNIPISPIEDINPLYERLISNNKLFETRSDFLKIVRLRSIDIIILKKELPNSLEITNLKRFKTIFLRRINIISNVVYISLVISLIFVIYSFYLKSKFNQDIINVISAISGIIGLGLLVFMKWVSKQIEFFLLFALGYIKIFKNKTSVDADL